MKTQKLIETEKQHHIKNRHKCLKITEASLIVSLSDLIKIGQNIQMYKNIDTIMLWRITPYLEELNNLVGMDSLKESIFSQVIYYLQGMHLRNIDGDYLHTIIINCDYFNIIIIIFSNGYSSDITISLT